jgi:hypothetical protein
MASSNQEFSTGRFSQINCLIRREWVVATPEEMVRQKLIRQMVYELGFPLSGLVLEKSLSQMPHIANRGVKVPLRRADLICFAKGVHSKYELYPLLLVEVKAVKLTPKAKSQVIGYNRYLQAPYICLANEGEVNTGWYDSEKADYHFINHLPSYLELLRCYTQLK